MENTESIFFVVSEEVPLPIEMARAYNCALDTNGNGVGASFRYLYPDKLNVGDIFYLGKVSGKNDSIYQRLGVHFGGLSNNSTSGIKMQMLERRFLIGKLVVHTFLLESQYKELSKIIVDPVEKILHNKINTLTGYK